MSSSIGFAWHKERALSTSVKHKSDIKFELKFNSKINIIPLDYILLILIIVNWKENNFKYYLY